jgi:hypothetical protein
LERAQRHARERGWELSEEDVFRDEGYSGTALKRPALDALRDKVWMRELEIFVVLSGPAGAQLRAPDGPHRGAQDGRL